MTGLTKQQKAVLRAAPIGVDDASNGDPYKAGRFIYHGVDGRTARAMWHAGLLEYREVSPYGDQGGLLRLTEAGRRALDRSNGDGDA